MNSKNTMDKGWGRRDNRPQQQNQKFRKDFSGKEYYEQDWGNKNKFRKPFEQKYEPKYEQRVEKPVIQKVEFDIKSELGTLISHDFRWQNLCLL